MSNDDLWDREDLYSQQLEEIEEQSQVEAESDLYEDEEDFDKELEGMDLGELFEDDGEDESLIDEARVRLEQGRLYEMLIKHDLFDGVDAMPNVVDNVQKEIKNFIKDRLQILVGMKQEKSTEVHIVQDSKFNDMEVQALKMIAAKVTKGASVEAPTTKKVESQLNTIKKKPKSNKINALGGVATKAKPVRKKVTPSPKVKQPIQARKPARKVKKEVTDKSTFNKSVTDIVKKDIKYIKSLESMSLEDANDVVSQRHPNRISKNAPDQTHVNAHYQTKMSMNQTASTFATLLAAAKTK